MTKRKLSSTQRAALEAMARLAAGSATSGPVPVATAREIAEESRQSSDGAAYTLRSLVRRGLVTIEQHDGKRGGYKLTPGGAGQAKGTS